MDNELAVLGAALLLAGLFARVGRRLGLPTIPFFIVAGIVFGPHTPGIVVLEDPEEIHLLAMLGLVLLLFHLGIEFSINELLSGGRRLLWAGGSYIALNFGAGLVLGWALGWGTREIFVIAGMIGTSSTAIVTKLILDLRRVANPETGMILGIIVVEDVFLAFYLALLQPIFGEQEGAGEIVLSIATAFAFLIGLFALARWGARLVRPVLATGGRRAHDHPHRRLRRLRRRLRPQSRARRTPSERSWPAWSWPARGSGRASSGCSSRCATRSRRSSSSGSA